ncbi:MAG: hypothetical protein EYC69_06075 [Bacteroidetes bacterium]|nr:MAG: hypothetical protein EYC69_06075 [Bacteroidota bacterium]
MEFNHITAILLSGTSICLGAFLGVLRSKIFSTKSKTNLHRFFYIFSTTIFLISIFFLFNNWNELFAPNWFGIVVEFLAIISSVSLFILTKKYLVVKDIFNTSELDPIINKFTESADTDQIKLFGGDLNFFGNSPPDIDLHPQYRTLRSLQFKKILILCEKPKDTSVKIRYGKILHDMPQAQIRYYEPEQADLKVRGRIIEIHRSIKLLMYTKIQSKIYQAIETDTANSNGALYNNIWELVWSLALVPDAKEMQSYKDLFLNKS